MAARTRATTSTPHATCYTSTDAWARLVVKQVVEHATTRHACAASASASASSTRGSWRDTSIDAGIAAVAIWGDSPEEERARPRCATWPTAGSTSCSPSTCSTRVSTSPPSTPCSCCAPPRARRCSCSSSAAGCGEHPGRRSAPCSTSSAHHRNEFRFDRRFRALLGGTRREVERAVEQGFPFLPAGCHMELDREGGRDRAAQHPRGHPVAMDREGRGAAGSPHRRPDSTSAGYLDETGLELEDVYDGRQSWSDLREAAGARCSPAGRERAALRRASGGCCTSTTTERIATYRALSSPTPACTSWRPDRARAALLRMLVAGLADQASRRTRRFRRRSTSSGAHPQVRAELRELLDVLDDGVDHVHHRARRPPRRAAAGPRPVHPHRDPGRVRHRRRGEGRRLAERRVLGQGGEAELLAFTLDKSSGEFSPTTRYRDYAISRDLIHWESQSVTRADSETGCRYRNHERDGRSILLFARLRSRRPRLLVPRTGHLRGHEGERPMAITWELATRCPATCSHLRGRGGLTRGRQDGRAPTARTWEPRSDAASEAPSQITETADGTTRPRRGGR